MPRELPQLEDYSPFSKLIGLRFTEFGDGRSQAILEIRDELLNKYGTVHGGVIYSLADTGMGAALWSTLEEDEVCKTMEITITYHRPAFKNLLRCDSRVVERNGKIANIEAEISNEGKLISRATGTFHISRTGRTR